MKLSPCRGLAPNFVKLWLLSDHNFTNIRIECWRGWQIPSTVWCAAGSWARLG